MKTLEQNKKLIAELNELMKTEIDGFDEENKVFPYLGWFWRNIDDDYEADGLPMSYYGGIWWLDEAGKWSYPQKRLSVEETNKALKIWITIVKANIDYFNFSKGLGANKDD